MNPLDPPAATGGAPGEPDPRFRLDPAHFPQRLDLELPEELFEQLQQAAREGDCSVSELVQHLISQYIKQKAPER